MEPMMIGALVEADAQTMRRGQEQDRRRENVYARERRARARLHRAARARIRAGLARLLRRLAAVVDPCPGAAAERVPV
ncbi:MULTISPECIES: hypothetical protein [unclassified Microbacterium]|uniref:hypothetical protein n=1 Tax=unclassified Microbacterium TaxID=2609290 RepID=UPI0022F02D73|nr:hypothetical protein [Streptomyces sp. MS2A]